MSTKTQILDGVVNYAEKEILPKIMHDKAFSVMMTIFIAALKKKPEIIDSLLKNEMISPLIEENEDGEYDTDTMLDLMEEALKKYGDFPVTIPAVKFISPTEKTLKFSPEDVSKLRKYIAGDNDDEQ